MKKLHYQNIGFPKTGTTWVYHQFLYHPEIDCKVDLNNKEFNTNTKEKYLDFYKDYDVSYNLRTLTYTDPNKLFYATHISFTWRNLFDLLNTWYNYLLYNPNYKHSVQEFLNIQDYNFKLITDVEKIFDAWKSYEVKWFFYDDLVTDNQLYFYNLCDYLGISKYYDSRIKVKFKTNITKQILFDDESIIKYINNKITIIEDHTKRDLSHWKK